MNFEDSNEPEESEESEICHHCNGSGHEPGESNDDDFYVPDEPDFPENYQGDF